VLTQSSPFFGNVLLKFPKTVFDCGFVVGLVIIFRPLLMKIALQLIDKANLLSRRRLSVSRADMTDNAFGLPIVRAVAFGCVGQDNYLLPVVGMRARRNVLGIVLFSAICCAVCSVSGPIGNPISQGVG
jgi:hypothetical protein